MVFFFNYTATTEIYPLTLHDALPIFSVSTCDGPVTLWPPPAPTYKRSMRSVAGCRSEEHTSELQSRLHLVCRLLLEKKKKGLLGFVGETQLYSRSFRENRLLLYPPIH